MDFKVIKLSDVAPAPGSYLQDLIQTQIDDWYTVNEMVNGISFSQMSFDDTAAGAPPYERCLILTSRSFTPTGERPPPPMARVLPISGVVSAGGVEAWVQGKKAEFVGAGLVQTIQEFSDLSFDAMTTTRYQRCLVLIGIPSLTGDSEPPMLPSHYPKCLYFSDAFAHSWGDAPNGWRVDIEIRIDEQDTRLGVVDPTFGMLHRWQWNQSEISNPEDAFPGENMIIGVTHGSPTSGGVTGPVEFMQLIGGMAQLHIDACPGDCWVFGITGCLGINQAEAPFSPIQFSRMVCVPVLDRCFFEGGEGCITEY